MLKKLDCLIDSIVGAMVHADARTMGLLLQLWADVTIIRATAAEGHDRTARAMLEVTHAEYLQKMGAPV